MIYIRGGIVKKIVIIALSIIMLTGCSEYVQTSTDYQGISNRSSGWGFKKEKGKAPEMPADIVADLTENNAFYIGDVNEKKLYLTFDEGYENGYTAQILDVLAEKNVPAAFFVTGDYFERSNDLVKRMVEEGHIVGNHTYRHKNLPTLSSEDVCNELSTLNDKFREEFGCDMKYMRPPEGEYSPRVLAIANDMGYKTAFWSFAYKDWLRDSVYGAEYAKEHILPYLHNGEILLLHAVSKDNADALKDVIDIAREQGFEFYSLDDIK